MKTKTELKLLFETNDTPTEADFHEWMDAYWHKEDPEDIIPSDRVDMSSKADKTAENLSIENIASWKTKLIEPSQITIPVSSSINTNAIDSNGRRMSGKTVLISNGSNNVTIECRADSDANFNAAFVKLGSGTVTFNVTSGAGLTLTDIDKTLVLNGSAGSTASLVRSENTYFLRIYNA